MNSKFFPSLKSFDTNGNMTWDGERSLEWDGLNRLIRVSGNVGTISKYYYNAMNMRVQKWIDTDSDGLLDDKTNYIYCHQKVCVEQDENGNLKKDYVHGGQYIDQVLMESDSSSSLGSYYLTDLRYSVYAVVDSDGAVTERYRYDAYGKRDVMTPGFVVVNTDAKTEFGYTGRRHDTEDTALMYFRARYYSPDLGRFVGRDPLGQILQPMNIESYSHNPSRPRLMFSDDSFDSTVPNKNYKDGMNLYRSYFVVNGTDPSGKCFTGTLIGYGSSYHWSGYKCSANCGDKTSVTETIGIGLFNFSWSASCSTDCNLEGKPNGSGRIEKEIGLREDYNIYEFTCLGITWTEDHTTGVTCVTRTTADTSDGCCP